MEWVWVPKIRNLLLFNCVCGFFIDAMVLFFCDDVTLKLWMLSFESLLIFLWGHILGIGNWCRMFLLGIWCVDFIK